MANNEEIFHLDPLIEAYERAVQNLDAARVNYNKGNLAQAEYLCREYLERTPGDSSSYLLLGKIADRLGVLYAAKEYYAAAIALDPGLEEASVGLERILEYEKVTNESRTDTNDGCIQSAKINRYLLTKAWGFGFWSDVDQVLGQLLLAEITGRVPVVYWGENSLFASGESSNAFDLYFEPVSDIDIPAVTDASHSFYPPKWNHQNILENNINKWQGRYSRIASIALISRNEDVLVNDYYAQLFSLLPWVPKGHELYGMGAEEVYRRLFNKYLVLKSDLADRIETFWTQNMAGRKWLAVHVRGTDKELEVKNLDQLNMEYFDHIERMMACDPDLHLFLLTDSADVLSHYLERYGNKILYTDCLRVSGKIGIHYSGYPGRQVAEDVIRDTYLSARCDYFLGNGASSVSTTILHLKNWKEGTYRLIGRNRLFKRNFLLHHL